MVCRIQTAFPLSLGTIRCIEFVETVISILRSWHTLPILRLASILGLAAGPVAANEVLTPNSPAAQSIFKPGLVYGGAAFTNLGGGMRKGGSYSSNLNLQLNIDVAALFGVSDTIAYLDALWVQGGQPASYTGDAQEVSSISAPNSLKLYEAWIQKNSFDNHLSALVGLYDLNSEFYSLHSAGLFLNSSFGIGPEFSQSGIDGPSIFPDTALGVRLAFRPSEGMVFRAALLDGGPARRSDGSFGAIQPGNGALLVGEMAFTDRTQLATRPVNRRLRIGRQANFGEYDQKLAIGAWHYTANFDDLSAVEANGQPVRHSGSGGFYAFADKLLYKDPANPAHKFTGFLQAGLGDDRVNRFGSYFGAGLTAVGLFDGRPNDELGLSIAHARNGSHYLSSQRMQALPVTRAETAIELTYLIQVNPWLALQPDLQYIIRPGTTPEIPNARVFQLRVEMSF